MAFSFQDLNVYQQTLTWIDRALDLSNALIIANQRSLSDQLTRASTSIALNIAEGNGRWHKAEKRQFYWIARGSAFECASIIHILKRRNLITETTQTESLENLEIISKMLSRLVQSTELLAQK